MHFGAPCILYHVQTYLLRKIPELKKNTEQEVRAFCNWATSFNARLLRLKAAPCSQTQNLQQIREARLAAQKLGDDPGD